MAGEKWLPSIDDRTILRMIVEEYRQGRTNSPIRASGERSFVEGTDHQAPEVYIAVPHDTNGIPALDVAGTGSGTYSGSDSDDEPGVGTCDIFQIVDGRLVPTGFSQEVYNLSDSVIDRDWILVVRDKFGSWFAVTGGGGGTVCPDRNEIHQITIIGSPDGGTLVVVYVVNGVSGDVTFNFDDTSAEVLTALEGHAQIGSGDVLVTGGPFPDATMQIEFQGALAATEIPLPILDWSDLGTMIGTGTALDPTGVAAISSRPQSGYSN